jgi:hypothetical protein
VLGTVSTTSVKTVLSVWRRDQLIRSTASAPESASSSALSAEPDSGVLAKCKAVTPLTVFYMSEYMRLLSIRGDWALLQTVPRGRNQPPQLLVISLSMASKYRELNINLSAIKTQRGQAATLSENQPWMFIGPFAYLHNQSSIATSTENMSEISWQAYNRSSVSLENVTHSVNEHSFTHSQHESVVMQASGDENTFNEEMMQEENEDEEEIDDDDTSMEEIRPAEQKVVAAHLQRTSASKCVVYIGELTYGRHQSHHLAEPAQISYHWELREVSIDSSAILAYSGSLSYPSVEGIRGPRLRTRWLSDTKVLSNAHDPNTGYGISIVHLIPDNSREFNRVILIKKQNTSTNPVDIGKSIGQNHVITSEARCEPLWWQIYHMPELRGLAVLKPMGPISRMLSLLPVYNSVTSTSAEDSETTEAPVTTMQSNSCVSTVIDVQTGERGCEYSWPTTFEYIKHAIGRICHLIVPPNLEDASNPTSGTRKHSIQPNHYIVDAVSGQVCSYWPIDNPAEYSSDVIVNTSHIAYTTQSSSSNNSSHSQLVVFDFAYDCL